jgi:hypothetical protein
MELQQKYDHREGGCRMKMKFKWGSAGCAAIALFSSMAAAQENYPTWAYFKNLALNTQASGAAVSNPVPAFPVLVRLTAADSQIFRSAAGHGQDVRFSKWDGTHLPYQIERWDSVNMKAELWVLVDTVKGSDSVQASYPGGYVKMYWGKSGAADSSNPAKVFDTANGYQATWHMGEAGGAVANDATINGYNLTPFGTILPGDTVGMIGRGKAFFGSGDAKSGGRYATTLGATGMQNSKLTFPGRSLYTISAWVLCDTLPAAVNGGVGRRGVVTKGNGLGSPGAYGLTGTYATGLSIQPPFWQGGDYETVSPTNEYWQVSASSHVWQHLVYAHVSTTSGAAEGQMYINGALATTVYGSSTSTKNLRVDTTQINVGSDGNGDSLYFKGIIDEVEIASTARSADWVRLSYQNQQTAQTLVAAGPIQRSGALAAPLLQSPVNGASNQALSLSLAWNTVATATVYEVQFSSAANFATTILDNKIGGTSQTVSGLASGVTYFWRVNATGTVPVQGVWSAAWSFTTAIPVPGAPTPISPTNGVMTVPLNVSLSWSTVPTATSYTVQVSNATAFSSTVFSQSGLTVTSASAAGLSSSTTYYWRSSAVNSGGSGPWSAVWTFGTIYGTAGIPILSTPANGATVSRSVTLSWGVTPSATSYIVQVSTLSTFMTMTYNQSGITGTSQAIGPLAANTTFYWRVYGSNPNGTGYSSVVWSFTTGTSFVSVPLTLSARDAYFTVKTDGIAYALASSGPVQLTFSDLLGRVALTVSRNQAAGSYIFNFRDCSLSPGRYIVQFKAAGIEKRAMVMIDREALQ